LHALRSGKWKLELPRSYESLNGRPGGKNGGRVPYDTLQTPLALYDLDADPGERTNLVDRYPDVVKRLLNYAEQARADMGDDLTHRKGTGRRDPGRL
jgi:arylsulfatase